MKHNNFICVESDPLVKAIFIGLLRIYEYLTDSDNY